MIKNSPASHLKQQAARDLKQHYRLGKNILGIQGPLVVGWLNKRYTECRKGNCKCTRGEKHGPFLYAHLHLKNRNVYRYIGKPEDLPLVRHITRYAEFRQTLARWRALHRQLDKEWVRLEHALTQRLKK